MIDCNCLDPYECECHDPLDDNPDVAELLRYNEPAPPPPVPMEPWLSDMIREQIRLVGQQMARSIEYLVSSESAKIIDPYKVEPGVPEE